MGWVLWLIVGITIFVLGSTLILTIIDWDTMEEEYSKNEREEGLEKRKREVRKKIYELQYGWDMVFEYEGETKRFVKKKREAVKQLFSDVERVNSGDRMDHLLGRVNLLTKDLDSVEGSYDEAMKKLEWVEDDDIREGLEKIALKDPYKGLRLVENEMKKSG